MTLTRIAVFAFLTLVGGQMASHRHGETGSWQEAWAFGAKVSLGLAVIGWITIGTPSCEDSDGMHCYEQASDGYVPTFQQRNERFAGILGQTMAAGTLGLWLAKARKEWMHKRKG
jgi:hypothetical protein